MGCAKSTGTRVISYKSKADSQDIKEDLFVANTNGDAKSSAARSKSVTAQAFRLDTSEGVEYNTNLKANTEKISNDCDIGKEGEDNEANVIEEGVKKINDFDLLVPKIRPPKKLPPIERNKPFSQGIAINYKPDFSIINSLLSKEQGKDFQNLNLEENDEKSLGEIMEESFMRLD